MLLNTDLHVADIEQKMTRGQFVKNTLTTIQQAVSESAPDAFDRPSILPDKNPMLNSENNEPPSGNDRRSFRHSFRPPPRAEASSSRYCKLSPGITSPHPFLERPSPMSTSPNDHEEALNGDIM